MGSTSSSNRKIRKFLTLSGIDPNYILDADRKVLKKILKNTSENEIEAFFRSSLRETVSTLQCLTADLLNSHAKRQIYLTSGRNREARELDRTIDSLQRRIKEIYDEASQTSRSDQAIKGPISSTASASAKKYRLDQGTIEEIFETIGIVGLFIFAAVASVLIGIVLGISAGLVALGGLCVAIAVYGIGY